MPSMRTIQGALQGAEAQHMLGHVRDMTCLHVTNWMI